MGQTFLYTPEQVRFMRHMEELEAGKSRRKALYNTYTKAAQLQRKSMPRLTPGPAREKAAAAKAAQLQRKSMPRLTPGPAREKAAAAKAAANARAKAAATKIQAAYRGLLNRRLVKEKKLLRDAKRSGTTSTKPNVNYKAFMNTAHLHPANVATYMSRAPPDQINKLFTLARQYVKTVPNSRGNPPPVRPRPQDFIKSGRRNNAGYRRAMLNYNSNVRQFTKTAYVHFIRKFKRVKDSSIYKPCVNPSCRSLLLKK